MVAQFCEHTKQKKPTEFYTLKGLILWYINYISIKIMRPLRRGRLLWHNVVLSAGGRYSCSSHVTMKEVSLMGKEMGGGVVREWETRNLKTLPYCLNSSNEHALLLKFKTIEKKILYLGLRFKKNKGMFLVNILGKRTAEWIILNYILM